jgi:hypothetical protein
MNGSSLTLSLSSLALASFLAGCGSSPESRGSSPGSASSAPAPAQGSTTTADWSCVGAGADYPSAFTVPTPGAATQGGTTALHLREVYTQNPIVDATVTLCDMFDEACASPLAQSQSDVHGDAQIALPASFYGYFQISGTGLPTNLVYTGGVLPGPTGLELTVYTGTALSMMTHRLSPAADPGSAVIDVEVLDCKGVPAPGVKLNMETNGSGMIEAYTTSAQATDASGLAFGFDVPAGWVGVVGLRTSDVTYVGGAMGFARPGAVTSIILTPAL